MKELHIRSKSPSDTLETAKQIAPLLHPGDLIIMDGDLGAGKTHFVKGLAAGLLSEDTVTSPTFGIANFYRAGQFDILHIDLYRITEIEAFLDLGLTDYFDSSVVCIEWGKKFAGCFDDYLLVSIKTSGNDERLITFAADSNKYHRIIDCLKK
jgi:tRNA threonylcarbamoyladenosine biosynthesis protein TsaE